MITGIEIENFKGVRERTLVELRSITLVFGPNSAGKSTLLHALQLGREILSRHNIDVDATDGGAGFIDLGGFHNYVHDRDVTRFVCLRFDLDLSDTNFLTEYPISSSLLPLPKLRPEMPQEESDVSLLGDDIYSGWVEMKIGWSATRERPYIAEYSIGLNNEEFATLTAISDKPEVVTMSRLNLLHRLFQWPNGATPEQASAFGIADFLYPGLLTLGQRQFLRADTVEESALPQSDNELEVTFAEKSQSYPPGRIYRRIREDPPDSVRLYEVIASRAEGSLDVQLNSLALFKADYFSKDRVKENRPLDEDELEYLEIVSVEALKSERVIFARPDKLSLSVRDQVDALPDFDKSFNFDFPLVVDEEEFSEANLDVLSKLLSRLILVPSRALQSSLAELRYVGPVREAVPRTFEPRRFPDLRRWAGGLAAWDELARDPDGLTLDVAEWLGAENKLNTGYYVRVDEYRELPIHLSMMLQNSRVFDDIDWDGVRGQLEKLPIKKRIVLDPIGIKRPLQPQDVGQGITQAVPVIVAAFHPFGDSRKPRGGLVAIEQPELHLNPRQQAALGDVFAQAIQSSRNQFILETHSEHLILRLQRRIRETTARREKEWRKPERPADAEYDELTLEVTDQDVSVLYARQEEGRTRFYGLPLYIHGEFVYPWPDDFFEIDFHERFGK